MLVSFEMPCLASEAFCDQDGILEVFIRRCHVLGMLRNPEQTCLRLESDRDVRNRKLKVAGVRSVHQNRDYARKNRYVGTNLSR